MDPLPPRPLRRLPLTAMVMAAVAVLSGRLPHARGNTMPCPYNTVNGTSTDTQTSLTWENPAKSSAVSLMGATSYCGALALDGGGWRLPTIKELQTIVHEGNANPAIDTTTFMDDVNGFVWSITPVTGASPAQAWGVYFDHGNTGMQAVGGTSSVRCVR